MSQSIQTSTVDIQSGNLSIPAYLACPTESAGLPLVIVIQEIFGVNAHIRDVTNRIAQEGYIAIAPHIFHRQSPGFEVGYTNDDVTLGRVYKDGTQASELLQDIQGAIAYGREHFQPTPDAVGCIGFCFGGHVAYLGATLPDVKATASFYGGGIPVFTPGGGAPTITQTPKITGTLYAFFGLEDALIPLEQIDQIEAALQEAAVDHQVFRYPDAGHGFFCDQRSDYHEPSAQDAWAHVKTLFKTVLRDF